MHTFEQQAETLTILSGFLSAPKETFLQQCHFHGIILLQLSPETSPQEIVQQRSECRVLNESFDQNFHMAAANLSPDFRNCQFHGYNFHFSSPNWDAAVNSGYNRFDDHLIQSNNVSSWKKKILVLRLFYECFQLWSDFPKSSPWYFHVMAISSGCKDQSYVMFSLVT